MNRVFVLASHATTWGQADFYLRCEDFLTQIGKEVLPRKSSVPWTPAAVVFEHNLAQIQQASFVFAVLDNMRPAEALLMGIALSIGRPVFAVSCQLTQAGCDEPLRIAHPLYGYGWCRDTIDDPYMRRALEQFLRPFEVVNPSEYLL